MAKRKKQAYERKMAYERSLAYEKDPLPDDFHTPLKEETFSEKVSFGLAMVVGAAFFIMVLQAIAQSAFQLYHYVTGLW